MPEIVFSGIPRKPASPLPPPTRETFLPREILSKLRINSLRDLAKALGADYTIRSTKAQLVDLLGSKDA